MSRVRARVHALRQGTWPADPVDLEATAELIDEVARRYDPAVYRAPVVIGHPTDSDPAYGDVLAATAEASGLWLEVAVQPELAELVQQGSYRAVSVSLWPPDARGNPSPGGWYLRHLGVLGATAPAVKGLQPLALGEDAGVVSVTLETIMNDEKSGDTSRQLAERELALVERERRLLERERALQRASFEQELAAHVKAARLASSETTALVALMERLADAGVVTLAEGERPALDVLRAFLGRLPARVDLREISAGRDTATVVGPALPDGYALSERKAAVWARAQQIMAEQGARDFVAAVRAAELEVAR